MDLAKSSSRLTVNKLFWRLKFKTENDEDALFIYQIPVDLLGFGYAKIT